MIRQSGARSPVVSGLRPSTGTRRVQDPLAGAAAVRKAGVVSEALSAGRRSFDRQAWRDAFRELSAADREAPLALDDLEHWRSRPISSARKRSVPN